MARTCFMWPHKVTSLVHSSISPTRKTWISTWRITVGARLCTGPATAKLSMPSLTSCRWTLTWSLKTRTAWRRFIGQCEPCLTLNQLAPCDRSFSRARAGLLSTMLAKDQNRWSRIQWTTHCAMSYCRSSSLPSILSASCDASHSCPFIQTIAHRCFLLSLWHAS